MFYVIQKCINCKQIKTKLDKQRTDEEPLGGLFVVVVVVMLLLGSGAGVATAETVVPPVET